MDGRTFDLERPNLLAHLTCLVSKVCDQLFARFEQPVGRVLEAGFDALLHHSMGAAISPWGVEANKPFGKNTLFSIRNGGLRGCFPLCPVENPAKK